MRLLIMGVGWMRNRILTDRQAGVWTSFVWNEFIVRWVRIYEYNISFYLLRMCLDTVQEYSAQETIDKYEPVLSVRTWPRMTRFCQLGFIIIIVWSLNHHHNSQLRMGASLVSTKYKVIKCSFGARTFWSPNRSLIRVFPFVSFIDLWKHRWIPTSF